MNIILLGEGAKRFQGKLSNMHTNLPIDPSSIAADALLISYGYRHILRKTLLNKLKRPPINLHISLLPWNRGADPNLWSFLQDTPKGVTIHEVDEGLDTGPILAQRELTFANIQTLRHTYELLQDSIVELFHEVWPKILSGAIQARPQTRGGSEHRSKDKEKYQPLLRYGWDTPVGELIGKAKHD